MKLTSSKLPFHYAKRGMKELKSNGVDKEERAIIFSWAVSKINWLNESFCFDFPKGLISKLGYKVGDFVKCKEDGFYNYNGIISEPIFFKGNSIGEDYLYVENKQASHMIIELRDIQE